MKYKKKKGPWFDWLYVDFDNLFKVAQQVGLKAVQYPKRRPLFSKTYVKHMKHLFFLFFLIANAVFGQEQSLVSNQSTR